MLWILFALAGCAAVLLLSRHTNGLQRLVGRGPTNAGLRNIGRLFDAIPRRLMSISRPGAMPKLLRSPVARIDRLGGILNDPALSAVLWLGLITALFIAAMYA